jgi:hypothetical protein
VNRFAKLVCGAIIGYALGYAAPIYARLPHLHYDPIARAWRWTVDAGAIPMGYLGLVAYGLAGAVIGAALFALIPFRRERTGLVGAWTLTTLALVAAYFTWNNWP